MIRPWMPALLLVLGTAAPGQEKPAPDPAGKAHVVLESGGHTAQVVKVFFTADGKELVSVGMDHKILCWDVESGELKRTLRPPNRDLDLHSIAVSPDAATLAVPGRGAILLVGVADGQVRAVSHKGFPSYVGALAFSPDGTRLAVGSNDHWFFVMDVKTGIRQQRLWMDYHVVGPLGFSPDGNRVLGVGGPTLEGGPIGVLDLGGGKSDKEIVRGLCFAWSHDGRTLAVGRRNGIELWDPADRKVLNHVEAGPTTSLEFLPGDQELLTTGTLPKEGKARVSILDARTGKEVRAFQPKAPYLPHPVTAAVSPDGKLVASASGPGNAVSVWRKSDGTLLHTLQGRGATHVGAGWSPDGNAVAWGNSLANSPNYHGRRPLHAAFNLAELQFVAKPDFKEYRRAVLKSGDDTLSPEALSVSRGGDQYSLQVWESGAGTSAGTLLPDDRVVVAGRNLLWYFDLKVGAKGDKEKHRFYIPPDKAVDKHAAYDVIWDVAPSPDNRYVLVTSRDQMLRVWRLEPKKLSPLLSLFVAGDDWIAWTPEGYYAASPGGEQLMGWRIDNGADKAASFYPASKFRASLYRPDIIKLLLKEGSLQAALAAADKARPPANPPPAAPASVEDVLPPVAVITTPDAARIEAKEAKLLVKFVATPVGKQPITAARLLVNGRPYRGDEGLKKFDSPRPGAVRGEWTVDLAPGENRLAVEARTAVSKAASEPVVVTLPARGLVREGAAPEEVRRALLPSLYVLAVGISDYPGRLKLRYAADDARALAEAFEKHSKGLFKQVKVKPLPDKEATRRGVMSGLTWLRKQMTQNDVGVVFFAGHGARDSDGRLYLLPVDVDPNDLLATAVPGEEIKGPLASTPGRFVVMLDACHAGAVDGGGRRAAGSLTDDLVRDLATDDFGVIVMCSAMGREFAEESAEVKHGYFTLALVEGLSGKAEKSVEGAVYMHHLNAYVTDRVKELSKGRQHPVTVTPGTVRSFPLSKP